MINKTILTFFLLGSLQAAVHAQPVANKYVERVNIIRENIQQHFFDASKGLYYEAIPVSLNEKPFSYLWPLCALIQAANEVEIMDTRKDLMTPVYKAIDQYYNTLPPKPGYQAYVTALEKSDRYYDDNQWIAIASLDAYSRTKKTSLLDKATEIYDFMMTGYDTASGAGIYWRENDYSSKNTCSNGPGILIALQLYQATGKSPYLDTALILYDWQNKYLQAPSGIYYDNLKIPSLKIDSAVYTYNTGTMLQANVLLYHITKEKKYLAEAKRLAKAAKNIFYKNNRLPGLYWFNAVLLRGLVELYRVEADKEYLAFFREEAERIWKDERDAKNLLGKKTKSKTLIDQAAMLEIYARLANLE